MVGDIRNQVRYLLAKNDMTLTELGRKIGTSTSDVCRFIHNYRDMRTSQLIRIADVFGVSLDWLTGRTKE